ncbi:MAG TPA: HPr family phosphocarrier protein [Bacillota bacterium]|nr:HPr family phosphocarrier protein [Bacillota bacterium]HOR85651.1 HPr family phosphocarrier protein [Bacillota bacterium]
MKEITVSVKNETGLHARPAAVIVGTASRFKSNIFAVKGGKEANLKSLLSLLGLGVCMGDTITLKADGPDESEALDAIISALSALGE